MVIRAGRRPPEGTLNRLIDDKARELNDKLSKNDPAAAQAMTELMGLMSFNQAILGALVLHEKFLYLENKLWGDAFSKEGTKAGQYAAKLDAILKKFDEAEGEKDPARKAQKLAAAMKELNTLLTDEKFQKDVEEIGRRAGNVALVKEIAKDVVITIVAAVVAFYAAPLLAASLPGQIVAEGVVFTSAHRAFGRVVGVDSKTPFAEELAQNTLMLGVFKGIGSTYALAAGRVFGQPASRLANLVIAAGGDLTQIGTGLTLAELQAIAATGQWLTTDQLLIELAKNGALVAGMKGAGLAKPGLDAVGRTAGRQFRILVRGGQFFLVEVHENVSKLAKGKEVVLGTATGAVAKILGPLPKSAVKALYEAYQERKGFSDEARKQLAQKYKKLTPELIDRIEAGLRNGKIDLSDLKNYFARQRLPKTNGSWIEGTEGNGVWRSTDIRVRRAAAAPGGPIPEYVDVPFQNNFPVFNKFVQEVHGIRGETKITLDTDATASLRTRTDRDFSAANTWLAEQLNNAKVPAPDGGEWTVGKVQDYLSEKGLQWHHHEDMTTMQLMPQVINDKIGHIGGRSLKDLSFTPALPKRKPN